MRIAIAITLLLLSAFSATALNAHFEGSSLCIRDGGIYFALPDLVDDHAFYTTIHAIQKRGSDYFIVFGTSELSRGWPPRDGNCGCGVESYVKWMHVNNRKIAEEKEGRFESCFRNIYNSSSIVWKDGQLLWSAHANEANDNTGKTGFTTFVYSWVYDPLKPKQGIVEIKTKVEQDTVASP